MKQKVRVLLVDDSLLVLTLLKRIISADDRLEVVGAVTSGQMALDSLKDLNPDVICTDFVMRGMDGLELTRRVMAEKPIPILIVSSAVQKEDKNNIFNLLQAGAVDVFPKPRGNVKFSAAEEKALRDRLFIVGRVHVYRINPTRREQPASHVSTLKHKQIGKHDLVLMGGSTGAPQVYSCIFSKLKQDFPAAIIAVQHMSEGFIESFVGWLNRNSQLTVKLAEHNELIKSGVIYFPPDGAHVKIVQDRLVLDFDSPPVHGSKPSVDVTFRSIDNAVQAKRTLAVLLTGMGRDGAAGLAHLHALGASTIAQTEDSCAIFGMPAEAIKLNAVDNILSPFEIASALNMIGPN